MESFKINIMKEISISESGFGTMCRSCLSSDASLASIFSFSSKMENTVAGVIIKWAAVQVTRGDKMPDFICQTCYTQLESTHQFLTQIEQSDKTLRHYLQQFYASDKPIKAESSVQPSKDSLFDNSNKDINVKCESLELNDLNWKETEPVNSIQENKNNEELRLKCEIKVEPIDASLFFTTECETDQENISSNINGSEFSCEDSKTDINETKVSEAIAVNWKENKQENQVLTNKFMEEKPPKFEMKVEQTDDNSFILTESVDKTVNASFNEDGSEISCENTQTNIGHASENFSSVNVTENFSDCDETNKNISGNRMYCDFCTRSFSSRAGLNHHKRTHTGEKPYQCDLCNKCFFRLSHLRTHEIEHTGAKPYQCDLCNVSFARSSDLNRHNVKHAGEKPYQCDICEKRFTQSGNLSLHKRTHTGERPYECDLCSKSFARSSNLNRHKLKHAGAKPYQCDLCNKCFFRLSHLRNHKSEHTGEKLYQCDVCNKSCSTAFNLNEHKRIHTGEKPYQCDFCNKCFALRSNLISHMRIHTGEKPYQCDFCNKCFSQSSHLNKHIRTHTGEKPYQCDFCNRCFSQSSHLNKHKLTHIDK